MDMKGRLSIILKLVAASCAAVGVFMAAFSSPGGFMSGSVTLMYFTIQSNIFLAAVLFAELFYIAIKQKGQVPAALGILHFWAVCSITLTFAVFCFMLAPFLPNAWNAVNILTHLIAPLAAIADYLLFDRLYFPSKKQIFLATIPAYCYVAFTVIAYLNNWSFSADGRNYPYAFLNYGGSAGLFGFSTDTSDSLFIGSFYWILILSAFIIGIAALYRLIHNRAGNKD